jgi:uncharacterized protein
MAKKKSNKRSEKKTQTKKNKISVKYLVIIAAAILAAVFLIYTYIIKDDDREVNYYTFKKEGELTFTDTTGKEIVKIDIEIADNDYRRQLGLMNRTGMEENQGMLFIFPTQQYQSFWMLNTLFSLDMIFINKENKIVTIHKNTKPLSQESYPSTEPSIYVLEVVAGFTDKYNINVGDYVYWMGTRLKINN